MKNKLKFLLIGFLFGIILTNGAVIAKSGSEMLEVFYSNIKIFIDGNEVFPNDVNGNTVEPFIYNGTTYLPIRAIGEALDKEVKWDAQTSSVYLITPNENEEKNDGINNNTISDDNKEELSKNETDKIIDQKEETKEETEIKTGTYKELVLKNIQQISGYKADDINGKINVSWTPGKKDAYFQAVLKCNNGGLADYVNCKINLIENTSSSENHIEGLFEVYIDNTLKYEKIYGIITIDDSKLKLNTREYDYNLVALLEEKKFYADWKTTSTMVFDVKSLDDKAASGLLSIDFDENKTNAKIQGTVTVGNDKYTFEINEVIKITENEFNGFFKVFCNDELITDRTEGAVSDLHTPLGEYLTFSVDGLGTFNMRLVETVHS